jgi:hypothetical protein
MTRVRKNPALSVRPKAPVRAVTIPTDLERQRFQALAYSLDHAKARSRVMEMLEADYPLTKEDKVALAAGICRLGQDKTDLMRKPTKHDRGRKRADGPWSFRQAEQDLRELTACANEAAAKAGRKVRITQRDMLEVVATFWDTHDRRHDFERHRGRLISELHLDPPTRSRQAHEAKAFLDDLKERMRAFELALRPTRKK